MDHIRELQGRLFIIALVFVGISGLAYPFFDKIVGVILAPLGSDHQLVYLTPGGAFSFIIKVCLYIGIIGVLPLIIYHLYRFVMPAVRVVKLRVVLGYTIASLLLAAGGITFAYFISLPAALYFLTGFNLYHIDPMLTIDSYFSFVMTYLMAGALLFQIPLIMMIIDSASPLKPSKLMGYQRHIIVGSFIVAALISPTPDAMNQTILASPMVAMYQVGVVAIWSSSRSRKKTQKTVAEPRRMVSARHDSPLELPSKQLLNISRPVSSVDMVEARKVTSVKPVIQAVRPTRSMDGFTVSRPVRPAVLRVVPARTSPAAQLSQRPTASIARTRSIDGMLAYR
jgi:sec-independent protein translocase protein TatC